VDDGFLVNITDTKGGDQEGQHPQKQRQKRRPTRFSDKVELEIVNPRSGQVSVRTTPN
jgi:hypothetical protein